MLCRCFCDAFKPLAGVNEKEILSLFKLKITAAIDSVITLINPIFSVSTVPPPKQAFWRVYNDAYLHQCCIIVILGWKNDLKGESTVRIWDM